MSFEPRFPESLSLGATGGCGWKTAMIVTAAGDEYRSGGWQRSLGRWTAGHNLRSEADRDLLIAFHRVLKGRSTAFRFKDWTDFTVEDGEGVLVRYPGANAGSTMLAKQYSAVDVFGATQIVVRAIHKPVPGTVSFSDPGASVDQTSGIVAGGTAGVTTWTGEFDNWVRFEEDSPEIAVRGPVTAGWRGVVLVEHRLDPGDPA